jgi:hypothetical protein
VARLGQSVTLRLHHHSGRLTARITCLTVRNVPAKRTLLTPALTRQRQRLKAGHADL